MKEFVLKLDLSDDKEKRKALKTVATVSGIDEISIDMKGKTLTVIGSVDPISIVSKLRKKNWPTEIISVGPAKEPEKQEEPKKEENKNEEQKKEGEPKKEDEGEKEEAEKKGEAAEAVVAGTTVFPYRPYYPPVNTYYNYVNHSMEENPNACTIC